MRHFLTTEDWSAEDIAALLDHAAQLKQAPVGSELAGKAVALLFLNPSLRTRSSFSIGVAQRGGTPVVLEPGAGSWPIEFEPGVVMDGAAEEHIAEVAQVLSRYCALIGLRAFPRFVDAEVDFQDRVIRSLVQHAQVPIINMETIVHPCQELALALTMREHLGEVKKRKLLVTWTYHPRPLNTAVANSAVLIGTKLGMDVTLLCPEPAYALHDRFMKAAADNAAAQGGSFAMTHDIDEAYAGADVVYAKSWGALPFYGNPEAEKPHRDKYRHFIVDEEKMAKTDGALFSHCLPLRRNVKATDGVMDAPYCVAIDEAENRLHVQKAIMLALLESGKAG